MKAFLSLRRIICILTVFSIVAPNAHAVRSVSRPGLPTEISIPAIGVRTKVETVGATALGNMGVPRLAKNAAWYSAGKRPGEIGSAFIAGHLDNQRGLPAAFYSLQTIQIDDAIVIRDIRGVSRTFIVRSIREYDEGESTAPLFVSNARSIHLITCSGAWNQSRQAYAKRLVVSAEMATNQ